MIKPYEKAWTAKDISLLAKKWAAGCTSTVIGRILDRTRCSILGKVHRLKLPKRETPDTGNTKAIRRVRATKHLAISGVRVWNDSGPTPPAPMASSNTLKPLVPDMEDLKRNDCRFPSGHYGEAGFGFCGRPKKENSSYCEAHYKIAMTPLSPRKR
jgi:GcrA cell cycle regulator